MTKLVHAGLPAIDIAKYMGIHKKTVAIYHRAHKNLSVQAATVLSRWPGNEPNVDTPDTLATALAAAVAVPSNQPQLPQLALVDQPQPQATSSNQPQPRPEPQAQEEPLVAPTKVEIKVEPPELCGTHPSPSTPVHYLVLGT